MYQSKLNSKTWEKTSKKMSTKNEFLCQSSIMNRKMVTFTALLNTLESLEDFPSKIFEIEVKMEKIFQDLYKELLKSRLTILISY